MRILLDECVTRKLKKDIINHQVATVAEMGWRGIKNGALLSLAEGNFDILLTIDQNLPYQQRLTDKVIAIIILVAPNNR